MTSRVTTTISASSRTYTLPVNSPSRHLIVLLKFRNQLSPASSTFFKAALFRRTCSVTSSSGKGSQGLESRGVSKRLISVDSQWISIGFSVCIGLFNTECCRSREGILTTAALIRLSCPFMICTIPIVSADHAAGVPPWQSQSLQLRSESCRLLFETWAWTSFKLLKYSVRHDFQKCWTRIVAWLVSSMNLLCSMKRWLTQPYHRVSRFYIQG